MLNTDIHSDKATAPCQGAVKYWFACTRWHKETAELYNISPSFQLCFTRTQILNVCIWCGGFFFQAIRSKPASSVTAGTEWKIILGPYLHSLSLLFLLSVWARSLVCDWFISPENGAAPSSQIHFIARAHSFFFFFFKKPALHFSQPGAHSYSALHWSPQAWVAISNY